MDRLRVLACMLCALAVAGGVGEVRAQSDGFDWQSWGTATDTIPDVTRGARLYLSAAFIQEGSERVIVNGEPLTRDQYEINYQQGVLRIDAPLPESPTGSHQPARRCLRLGEPTRWLERCAVRSALRRIC